MAASVDAASSSSDEDHEEKERLREAVNSAEFSQKKDKQLDSASTKKPKKDSLNSVQVQKLMKLLDEMMEYVDHTSTEAVQQSSSPPPTVKLLASSHQPVTPTKDKNHQ